MNLKEAALNLVDYLDGDTPAFMTSAPGVGKSSIVKQIAAERGWKVIDFRASTRDPVALMGLPDLSEATTKWKVPDEFPQVGRDGAEGILFLDELNAAPPSMMAAMYGLVLDRKVGEYTVPPGWRIVAAGNRQSDRSSAQRMPKAMANRFAHIPIEPDTSGDHANVHIQYFNSINVDPILIAFLRFRPGLIHNMPDNEDAAFPTPRSWEQASKYLDRPASRRLGLLSGLVGDGAAAELEGFIRIYRSLPSLDLILADPAGSPIPTEPAARFAVATGLARKVDSASFENGMTYMCRLPREFEILFAMDAVGRSSDLAHTETFTRWAVRNKDVTIG